MRTRTVAFLLLAVATTSMASLPIINDDYPKARSEAVRRGVPVFVEVWAPW